MFTTNFSWKLLAFLVAAFCFSGSVCGALLLNGDFRIDSDGDGVADHWRRDSSTDLEGEYAVEKVDGRQCQKLILKTKLKTGQIFRVSQFAIPAQPEKTFLLTGEVKAEAQAVIFFYEHLQDGKYLTHRVPVPAKKNEWQKISFQVRTSPECRAFKLSLLALGTDAPIWFSNFAVSGLEMAPRLRLPRLASSPPLRASWDDAVWRDAAVSGTFVGRGLPVALPRAATNARLGMHGDTLHVLLKCDEPQMAKVNVASGGSWADDTIEIYLKTAAGDHFYHFGLTPAGARLEQVVVRNISGFHTDWYSMNTVSGTGQKPNIPAWESTVAKQENSWTAQFAIKIPDNVITVTQQMELLLARSRKLTDFNEDSSWGQTSGAYFRNSNCFAKLAVPPAGTGVADSELLAAPTLPPPGKLLVPAPQKLQEIPGASIVRFAAPVRVFVEPKSERALAMMELIFASRFGMPVQAVAERNQANVVLLLDEQLSWQGSEQLAAWQLAEGYVLQTGKVCEARARTHRGLMHALQSLAQLAAGNEDELQVVSVQVTDWPDMEWRGWHMTAPGTRKDMDAALKMIDTIAALKMNWISIQFDNRFQYERHPTLSGPNAPTKDDHRKLAARIELYGMEVIPMTQCWSHFNYFLKLPQYRHLAEIPDPPETTQPGRKYWNYCPRNPEVHALVQDMIEEHLECYPQARWYHVGLDEITFEPIAVCERCRDASGGTLLAEEIKRLHGVLAAKGKRMCMWGDQLLVEHNGGRRFRTAEALPEVPRDVVIFDWHYAQTDKYPSVKFFREQGFEVIGCGWFYPLNVVPFIAETFQQQVLGYGGTTWVSIAAIRHRFQLMTAFVLAGEHTWKKSELPLAELPYRPIEVFRRLYDGAAVRRPASFREVPIAAWGNMSLHGGGSHGWMGLGPEHDARSVPTGRNWFAGVPFTIPAEAAMPVVALASEKDDPDVVPDAAWQIPVNDKVAGLAFLQTCSVPEKFQRHMYDRTNINPVKPGQYVIYYEDGGQEVVPLTWGVNLASWNTQMGASDNQIGWQGNTEAGAMLTLEVMTWWNPKPDSKVVAVDFVSTRNTVRPVILGVTAIIQ